MTVIQTPEFWVAIGFIAMVAISAKPAWRTITKMLDSRSEQIKNTLDEATKLREEAQHLLAEYQRNQRNASREVEEIIAEARLRADHITKVSLNELQISLQRREQLALEQISQAETDATQAVRDSLIDLTIDATRVILETKLNNVEALSLIDEGIKALPSKLNQEKF